MKPDNTPEIPKICRLMLSALDRPETKDAHDKMHEELYAYVEALVEALYESGINPDDFGSVLFDCGVERNWMPQEILGYALVVGAYLSEQRRENSALSVWAKAIPDSILKL